jgi:23S rRNA pseudouridine2605 synthase
LPTFAEILEPVREQRPSRGGKPSRPTNKPSRREGDAGRPSRASFSEERSPDGRRKFSLPSSEGQSSRGPREDRPYGDRPQGDRPARSFGDKPAWGDRAKKPYGDRPQGDRPARSFGDKPAWGDRAKKPYGDRPQGDRPQKNFGPREDRPYGDRPQGDRPARSFGDKPAWGDKTPKSFGAGPKRGVRGDREYWEKKQQQRGKPRYKTAEEFAPSTDDMRLNRFLAHAGICSRRDADALIADGMVTVNGKIITEMGFKVGPGDDVRYAGERLKSERKVYVLLNKPKGFITTVDDEKARKTVMDLVANACKERIYPVGRLDRGTTGVLLLTNDGAMAKKLTHPSHGAKKIYHVTLDKPLTPGDMVALKEGLVLEDGPVMVDKAEFITPDDFYNLGVELHVGRNRIVRRIFEHMGYEVVKLDRTSFAGLTKKSLERGHYRLLNSKEISFLQML